MKFILTLLIAVSSAAFLNAQTAAPQAPAEPSAAPAAPGEPSKKIAYEVIPAKRVVTPTPDRPANLQPTDLKEFQKAQDEQKMKETIEKRQGGVRNTPAAQKAEQAPVESKPKE